MQAIGNYLIVKKEKEQASKTKGGLILTELQKEDIRYKIGEVKSVGTLVQGVVAKDKIYFDKAAGHNIEIDGEIYQVIKLHDVVVVL